VVLLLFKLYSCSGLTCDPQKLATDVKYGGGFYMKINVIIETPKILDWVDSKILSAVLSARIRGLTGKV
jgi:hypothetical protein